jgi:hypothetical protein
MEDGMVLTYHAVLCCAVLCCAVPRSPQMHHMEDVAVVSIFGTVGMLAAMAVVVGKLIAIYISMPMSAPTELVAKGVGFQVGCQMRESNTALTRCTSPVGHQVTHCALRR